MKSDKEIQQFLQDIIYCLDSDIAFETFIAPEDPELAKDIIAELVAITKDFLQS